MAGKNKRRQGPKDNSGLAWKSNAGSPFASRQRSKQVSAVPTSDPLDSMPALIVDENAWRGK